MLRIAYFLIDIVIKVMKKSNIGPKPKLLLAREGERHLKYILKRAISKFKWEELKLKFVGFVGYLSVKPTRNLRDFYVTDKNRQTDMRPPP